MISQFILRGCKFAFMLVLVMLLPACASEKPKEAPAAESSRPRSARVAGSEVFIPVRIFLLSDERPSDRYGAFGYLLFTAAPEDEPTRKRYVAACSAFVSALPSASGYEPSKNVMPTYWLLKGQANTNDCDDLVAKYDYARANLYAAYAKKTSAYGPILVAWDESPEGEVAPGHQLVLDASNFSNEDMRSAFLIWKGQFARTPDLWQQGFRLAQIRAEFKNLIQQYGAGILELITKKT